MSAALTTAGIVSQFTMETDGFAVAIGVRMIRFRLPYGDTNAWVHDAAVSVGLAADLPPRCTLPRAR